jgi:hypothetical protein
MSTSLLRLAESVSAENLHSEEHRRSGADRKTNHLSCNEAGSSK